jgi:2-polyprenyl-3-methyl-5-hydroxy-6-metoxy-1,4-benzoquinol methylase
MLSRKKTTVASAKSNLDLSQRQHMLDINKHQAQYYSDVLPPPRGVADRLWEHVRNHTLNRFRDSFDLKNEVYDLHRRWLGSLQDCKVLDLGCLRGNMLSMYLAEQAREYVGIDLSETAIAELRRKLEKRELTRARAVAVDFLADEFAEAEFDVIYAYGVMHHFRYFDSFLRRLHAKLRPGGIVVSYDPTETSWPVRALRRAYRPFQSHAAWEWPFSRASYRQIQQHFDLEEIQGFLGLSKWGLPLFLVPGAARPSKRLSRALHAYDRRHADHLGWALYGCMHVALKLRRR